MKKLGLLLGILLLGVKVEAGIINRTYNYTDGNTISANENNTNENTLYTEINGLLNAANIADGTITNADVADTQFTRVKFASAVQSTFTYVDTLGAYRRPVLVFSGVTTVDVSSNTGTANQTCIQFPDERRCVTENVLSTSVNRRFIITEAGSVSGTKNSGLRSGYAEAANTWYALYAVKTTDVATDFVVIGDTLTPHISSFTALNTVYGTNGWVYLGMIKNGDSSGAQTDIASFVMNGNRTYFNNTVTGGTATFPGILMAQTAGATSVTYTYAIGIGNAQIPSHLTIAIYAIGINGGSTVSLMDNSATTRSYFQSIGTVRTFFRSEMAASEGVRASNGSSVAMDIFLSGFVDEVLGIGFNPML